MENIVKIKYIDFFKVKLVHIDDFPPVPVLVLCSCKLFLEAIKTKVKTKPHTKICRPMVWAKGQIKTWLYNCYHRKDS